MRSNAAGWLGGVRPCDDEAADVRLQAERRAHKEPEEKLGWVLLMEGGSSFAGMPSPGGRCPPIRGVPYTKGFSPKIAKISNPLFDPKKCSDMFNSLT
jgi:hypothetical protein